MPPEELTLILKLRDEATKQLKSVRGTVTAIGGSDGGHRAQGRRGLGRGDEDDR